jgi:hypothetical protein
MMLAPLGPKRDTNLSDVAQAHGHEAAMRAAAREVASALLHHHTTMHEYLYTPQPFQEPTIKRAIEGFMSVFQASVPNETNNYGHAMLMLGYMDDALIAYMARNKTGQIAHSA